MLVWFGMNFWQRPSIAPHTLWSNGFWTSEFGGHSFFPNETRAFINLISCSLCKNAHLSSNSYNFWMQQNIATNLQAWILLCKDCKFGDKFTTISPHSLVGWEGRGRGQGGAAGRTFAPGATDPRAATVPIFKCRFTRFGDMFEGVPNFITVMWPKPRLFSGFLFVRFGEIVHVHQCAKFEVCSFTRFGDIFEGMCQIL